MAGRDVTHRGELPGGSSPSLPFFERLAPPPAAPDLVAHIRSWTKPGEVVVDLNGRGGWVARSAISEQRRCADYESQPLTQLLAEVVLRPPDVRHLDAAWQAIGASPLAGSSLKASIDALFTTRCPTCHRPVALESLIWETGEGGPQPVRREYRCAVCREQLGGGDLRHAAPDADDIHLASSLEPHGQPWEAIRRRFPVPGTDHSLVDQLLELHTPRQLFGLQAILERIEAELRAVPVTAGLRLALLHALLPASRLNGYPGRVTSLKVAGGNVRLPHGQWRERNPWAAFEDGYRQVRGFVQQLEAGSGRAGVARFGPDLLSLEDGTANATIADMAPPALRRLALQGERIAGAGRPSRVRLVLGQMPLRWTPDRLMTAYHATAWVLGREAAASLPLDGLLRGGGGKQRWEEDAAALSRGLDAVAPSLATTAHAVVLLDSSAPEALVAAALGGAAAGYRLTEARLHRHADDSGGVAVFVPPGGVVSPGPRTRANRALAPLPGGAGDPRTVQPTGLFAPPERLDAGPFSPTQTAHAVTQTAVELLQARGEPATFEQLFGDVLTGLDRSGQLARLGRSLRLAEDAAAAAPAPDEAGRDAQAAAPAPATGGDGANDRRPGRDQVAPGHPDGALGDAALDAPARANGHDGGATGGATGDSTAEQPGLFGPPAGNGRRILGRPDGQADAAQVETLLGLIRAELERPSNRRLRQIEPGQFWLSDEDDRAAAAAPLADRVEWATFGLLSAARELSEVSFFERMAAMFAGRDAADEPIVRACLESYRGPLSSPERIVCADELERRSAEHDETIATLAELGHKIGFNVWIGRRQQSRRVGGRPLASWLEEGERNVHLPLVARGPDEDLERVDCAWYIRHKAAFLFEVEWTAMIGEPVLVRHARIPTDENLVRFLVIPPERAELVGFKLARSPLLRTAFQEGNWHLLKWHHLPALVALDQPSLADLEPYLGLEAPADDAGEQLPLFGA